MTKERIRRIVKGFVDTAKWSVEAGFDAIELWYGAYRFFISSFLSPTSNKRTDEYRGIFENQIRFVVEVVVVMRAVIPPTIPLFLRVSVMEWLEESLWNEPSWRVEYTVRFASVLAEHGIDISLSGKHPGQKIKTELTYQVPSAKAVNLKKGLSSSLLSGASTTVSSHRASLIRDLRALSSSGG